MQVVIMISCLFVGAFLYVYQLKFLASKRGVVNPFHALSITRCVCVGPLHNATRCRHILARGKGVRRGMIAGL
jgi:hypothetical protein